jgi:hypothetical protein
MSDEIIAVIIGAVTAAVGTLATLLIYRQRRDDDLRSSILNRIDALAQERRAVERSELETLRVYADPLRAALERLLYRIRELRESDRAVFFLEEAPDTAYMEYKYLSTMYRLGAVLGWIRAYRRERALLDPSATSEDKLEQAIDTIQRHLADGTHVERQRLDELMGVLVRSDREFEENKLAELAVRLENILHQQVSGLGHKDPKKMALEDQTKLAEAVARLMTDELGVTLPEELVSSRRAEICAILGVQEAWLYRDWQSGIGDLMLHGVEDAPRRFDVIGFREFERRYLASRQESDHEDRLWFDRLEGPFPGLDLRHDDIFDARRGQILGLEPPIGALIAEIEERRKAMLIGSEVPPRSAPSER